MNLLNTKKKIDLINSHLGIKSIYDFQLHYIDYRKMFCLVFNEY